MTRTERAGHSIDQLMALLPPARPKPRVWTAWVCPRGGVAKRYDVVARSAPMARLRVMRCAAVKFPQGYSFSVRAAHP